MTISIVTISYNQGQFLEQCIQSVVQQSYPDIEFIVVDPGSSDQSRDVIERYRDQIHKVIFESDEGPADGLNKGFKCASGEVFGFLNADDFYLEGALQTVAAAFRSNHNWDVVSGNSLVVDSEGVTKRRFYARKFTPLRAVYDAATLPQQSTFFRAKWFREVGGFNPRNQMAWDGELWIEMGLAGARFARINSFLAAFRNHGENLSLKDHSTVGYKRYLNRMFKKVRGRDRRKFDRAIQIAMKALEYFENPRMFAERAVQGPALQSALE